MGLGAQAHMFENPMQFDEVGFAADGFRRCRELVQHGVDLGDDVRRHDCDARGVRDERPRVEGKTGGGGSGGSDARWARNGRKKSR